MFYQDRLTGKGIRTGFKSYCGDTVQVILEDVATSTKDLAKLLFFIDNVKCQLKAGLIYLVYPDRN